MDTATAPPSSSLRHQRGIEPAWPWDWENRPEKDGCEHAWEVVVAARLFDPNERVARCGSCHTPRCGYAEDPDPCTLRRHHEGQHRTTVLAG
ncbi:MAG: hypothetical protein ABJD68_06880 [Nakamurella sp.]